MSYPTGKRPRSWVLTPHQLELLQAIADGDSYEEIASEHWIGKNTISTAMQSVRIKLRASNTPNAIAIALRKGLIT